MQPQNYTPAELFKQALASPAQLADGDTDRLQTLLYSFPQVGLLRALQARSGKAGHISEAAAWFGNSALLQKAVQAPGSLAPVDPAQIIVRLPVAAKPAITEPQQQAAEPWLREPSIPLAQKQEPAIPEHKAPEPELQTFTTPPELTQPVITEYTSDSEPQQDSYHEVLNDTSQPQEPAAEPAIEIKEELPAAAKSATFTRPPYKPQPFDETQKLIVENLASNDYFVFDKAFAGTKKPKEAVAPAPVAEPEPEPVRQLENKPAQPAEETEGVTRYHDDTMPYSFMWWLDKTRSKHSNVYQPYAKPAQQGAKPAVPDEPPPEPDKKEEAIVERFLQKEPQIRPPSSDKLDSENKARKSAEDHQEIITETLARVYADQMLYAKAIAVYKILSLNNPEKRRYFASQIEILEKKIN